MTLRLKMFLFAVVAHFVAATAQLNVDMTIMLGRNALGMDDYLSAIHYFNQAIAAKPFLSKPYFYRAYAKFTLEDYSGANDDCTASINLNPYMAEVYSLRGLCRINLKDYAGAEQDYTRVLQEMPDDQGCIYNRALCRLQLKDYARADSDLTNILNRWPGLSRAYLVKAQIRLEEKDTLGALAWMDTLLVKKPREQAAWSFKGYYALQHEDYAAADSFLTRAIELRPDDHEYYVARAQARQSLDRFNEALADYDKTLQLVPEHFVAHYNRGLLRSLIGDYNRAIEDFTFILKKEPDNTLARYNRAELREKVGQFRGAIADYTELIKAYPNFVYGYMARANCRRKIGDKDGAAKDETVVARNTLDLTYQQNKLKQRDIRHVRKRSEHALEQYRQFVEEDSGKVLDILGDLYGKVQNRKAEQEPLPMFELTMQNRSKRKHAATAFLPELKDLQILDTPERHLVFSTVAEIGNIDEARQDESRLAAARTALTPAAGALLASVVQASLYNYEAAIAEAEAAAKADTLSRLPLMQLAALLARQTPADGIAADKAPASSEAALTRSNKALQLLDKALALSPGDAYIYYNRGCLYMQRGDIKAAAEDFTRAVEKDPRLAEAYFNRGIVGLRSGDTAAAMRDFSKAGELGIYQAYNLLKQCMQTIDKP